MQAKDLRGHFLSGLTKAGKGIALAGIVLGGSFSAFAQGKGDEVRERDQFELLQARYSTVAPAKAALDAWQQVRRIPLWRDASGSSPVWEEIGPRVLKHAWGDMDNSGRTSALVVDPTNSRVVYAGAAGGGIWKSVDGCKTWEPIADHQASLCFGSIALDPFDHNIVYAGTGEAHGSLDSFAGVGLLRSRNGGASWELLGSDVFVNQSFARIIPHPKRPGFIYGATTGGVYRSTDGGGTWVKLLEGRATDLLIDPSNPSSLIASVGPSFPFSRNGLWKTVDAGDHWVKLTDGLPEDNQVLGRIQMSNCLSYPNVVYVSFYRNSGALYGMYKSTDFGHSWVHLPNAPDYAGGQAWYDNYVAVNPVNPNVVFAGGTSTHRTIDGGATWVDNTDSYGNGQVHPDHHYMAFDPNHPRTAYLCGDGGVFRTTDLGESWESVCHGLGTIQFQSVDTHPWDKDLAWGGTQDNGTNRYSGSWEWTETFFGDGGITHCDPVHPNIVYTEYVGLAMSKSTDGGLSWFDCTNGMDRRGALFYAPFIIDPNNSETLVAGTTRVYRTTDGAANWTAISPSLGAGISALAVAPGNSAVIYAGTSNSRVWVTPNTGKDWYEITKGLPFGYVGDICVDPRNSRHVYLGQVGWGGNRLWESWNAGGSWAPIGDELPECPIRSIILSPRDPDTVLIGSEVGVFISTNGGARWERYGQGLPNAPVFSIVAKPGTGLVTVGTHGRGAWRIPIP